MTRILLSFLLSAAVMISTSCKNESVVAANDSSNVGIAAIERHLCIREYWGDPNPQQARFPVAIRTEGKNTYAWVDGLEDFTLKSHMATLFTILSKNGRTAVVDMTGYNPDLMRENFDFKQKRNRVFGHTFQVAELQVPLACSIQFEPDSALKLRMVSAVERTMIKQLSQANEFGGMSYPRRLKIVIANFDPDYDQTFVEVADTDEVFIVGLHEYADPLGEILDPDDYPFGQVYWPEQVKQIRQKIGRVGIQGEIELKN